jgi:ubiquitin carboxyl-terminal hydrolase 14
MGAADEVPQAPTEKIAFVEDMTDNELCQALDLPAGLQNLGNTCYLNAVIQCLLTVPELRQALAQFRGSLTPSESESAQNLTVAIRDVMHMMEKEAVVTPILLVQVLHLMFPRFAEKSEQGGFVQQDANECWAEIMRILQQKLPPLPCPHSPAVSIVDQFFGGRFHVTMHNTECEDEPPSHSTEDFLQLSCFISQGQSNLISLILFSLTVSLSRRRREVPAVRFTVPTAGVDHQTLGKAEPERSLPEGV